MIFDGCLPLDFLQEILCPGNELNRLLIDVKLFMV